MTRLAESRYIAESYFQFQSDNNGGVSTLTSRRLFSKHPHKATSGEVMSSLKNSQNKGPNISPALGSLMPEWELMLEMGINLVFYGFGSKTALLKNLVERHLAPAGWHSFRLDAYSKETSYADLLRALLQCDSLFPGAPPVRCNRIRERTELLAERAEKYPSHSQKAILIIEGADSPFMRNVEILSSIKTISQSNIRIILTVDHIHSQLLLNNCLSDAIWLDATTMVPYGMELIHLLQGRTDRIGSDIKWRGAQFVLASLTRTGKSVFKVLAEHHLEILRQSPNKPSDGRMTAGEDCSMEVDGDADDASEDENDGGEGKNNLKCQLTLSTWYQRCQEQLIVSNEIAFRTQLTEFIDHELVLSDDRTSFSIPFTPSQIHSLIEVCNQK